MTRASPHASAPSSAPSIATPTRDVFHGLDGETILRAAESTGVRATGRIVPLNSMENRVFSVETEEGAVVVKFYRPGRWTTEALLAEHALALLLREEEIPTPRYLPLVDPDLAIAPGDFHASLFAPGVETRAFPSPTLGRVGAYHYCVWERVAGRAPLEMGLEDLRRAGRLVARMHNLFENRVRVEAFPRPRLTTESHLLEPLARLEDWGRIPRPLERAIFDTGEYLLEGLRWIDGALDPLPVHGDLHRLNLIQTREGGAFWIVDFDDARLGPEIQDLWLLASGNDVSHLVPEGSGLGALDFLREGYAEFRRLPEGSESLVEPLRTLRMIHYMGWIAGRFDDDALFRETFGFFTTERYWEQVLADVETQRGLLEAHGLLDFGV